MSELPHSRDAERCLLGAVLLKPEIASWLSMPADAFYGPAEKHVWEAMQWLEGEGRAIDVLTLEERLAERRVLDAVGGLSFLSQLAIEVPTADNVEHYAEIVRGHYVSRAVALACGEVADAVKSGKVAAGEALSLAMERLAGVALEERDKAERIGVLVKERFQELGKIAEQRQRGEAVVSGIPTGIRGLDEMLSGIQVGIPTILAGRPGSGKSAVAMRITDAATDADVSTLVFSMEDSRDAYCDRSLAAGGAPAEAMRAGRLTREQLDSLRKRAGELWARKNWFVDDRGGITADEVVRSARRHIAQHGVRLVVVDYIQLLRWPRDCKNENDALSRSITTFQQAAKQDNVAYLVLSQLNRGVEGRDDKRPRVSDLRQSGALEERAKCVLLLYRPGMYEFDRDGEPLRTNELEIIIGKNSNGQTGRVIANWNGPTLSVW